MNRSGLALPAEINDAVKFDVIYPNSSDYNVDKSSFAYLDESQSLIYKVTGQNSTLSVSQQPTPDNFDLEKSLRGSTKQLSQGTPYSLIETSLGKAAITNFFSDKDLSKTGQGAILNANGTLLTVQLMGGQSWSQTDWEKFLASLRVGK